MRARQYLGSYLQKEDLDGPTTVTIASSKEEPLDDQPKLILYFSEISKGLVMNVTNINVLIELFGTDETEEWEGKQAVIYVDNTVMFGGKRVGGLRLRPLSKDNPERYEALATDDQIVKIKILQKELGISDEHYYAGLKKYCGGKKSARELTVGEASLFIDRLNKKQEYGIEGAAIPPDGVIDDAMTDNGAKEAFSGEGGQEERQRLKDSFLGYCKMVFAEGQLDLDKDLNLPTSMAALGTYADGLSTEDLRKKIVYVEEMFQRGKEVSSG